MESKKIVNYLLKCGVKPHVKGFRYLYEAILIVGENNNIMPKITKFIYPQIALKYGDSSSRVERSCRHAIQSANKTHKFMTNAEFIAKAALDIWFG